MKKKIFVLLFIVTNLFSFCFNRNQFVTFLSDNRIILLNQRYLPKKLCLPSKVTSDFLLFLLVQRGYNYLFKNGYYYVSDKMLVTINHCFDYDFNFSKYCYTFVYRGCRLTCVLKPYSLKLIKNYINSKVCYSVDGVKKCF